MSAKKIIIVDHELNVRDHLSNLLRVYCPEVEIIGEAPSVSSAFQLLRKVQPHALLLAVHMEDGTGFDLLDKFRQVPFQVIFQTAYTEYAIQAFRYNAIDYLLKPFAVEDLVRAIDKVQFDEQDVDFSNQIRKLLARTKRPQFERLVLSSSEGLHFVELKNIIRLQSDANYTTFFLLGGEKITVTKTIKTFEDLLPRENFFRPHQSHIVNLNFVEKVLREDGGYALMRDKSKVGISRSKKESFLKCLRARSSF